MNQNLLHTILLTLTNDAISILDGYKIGHKAHFVGISFGRTNFSNSINKVCRTELTP